jgi:3',5'-cyclic AMP phosphodiesterase CpdA
MDLAVMTGDLADNMQRNETEWVLRLLEGGTLDPSS